MSHFLLLLRGKNSKKYGKNNEKKQKNTKYLCNKQVREKTFHFGALLVKTVFRSSHICGAGDRLLSAR